MKKKLPALMWYPGDWFKDANLSMCSLPTRGFWFELLGAMHELGRSGQITGTAQQLARVCRCTAAEAEDAARELKLTKAADVSERDGIYTIINRRMKRENDEREATNKRVRKFRKTEDVTDCNKNETGEKHYVNEANKANQKEKRECNENETSYSSSSSSSSVTNTSSGSGGNAPTRARGKPPTTAADNPDIPRNRQWIELDPAEKLMALEPFVTYLQRIYPKKNVREIAKKLKTFCDKNGKAFALERLKGWVIGESESISEAEFLTAFGEESPPVSLIEQCQTCDVRGLTEITVDGIKRMTKCRHENLKKGAVAKP